MQFSIVVPCVMPWGAWSQMGWPRRLIAQCDVTAAVLDSAPHSRQQAAPRSQACPPFAEELPADSPSGFASPPACEIPRDTGEPLLDRRQGRHRAVDGEEIVH